MAHAANPSFQRTAFGPLNANVNPSIKLTDFSVELMLSNFTFASLNAALRNASGSKVKLSEFLSGEH